MALRAIADESEGVVLEVVLELGQGPVAPLVDDLLRASEVKGLDATSLLLQRNVVSCNSASWQDTSAYLDSRSLRRCRRRGARKERVGRALRRGRNVGEAGRTTRGSTEGLSGTRGEGHGG